MMCAILCRTCRFEGSLQCNILPGDYRPGYSLVPLGICMVSLELAKMMLDVRSSDERLLACIVAL